MDRGGSWRGDAVLSRRRALTGPIANIWTRTHAEFRADDRDSAFLLSHQPLDLPCPQDGYGPGRAGPGPPSYAYESSLTSGEQDLARRHGGFVEDARTARLRQVGTRLTSRLTNLTPAELRFFLLGDSECATAYTLGNGSIFMTAALFDRMRSEGEVAAVISQRITDMSITATTDPWSPRASNSLSSCLLRRVTPVGRRPNRRRVPPVLPAAVATGLI